MSLFVERRNHRPIVYELIYKYLLKTIDNPWSFNTVPMESDIIQWADLSDIERNLITSILKGFTKIESHVGCYWSDVVARNFLAQEVRMFARAASHQESIHFLAYAHLEDTLGIDTTEAYYQDLVAQAKLGYFFENLDEDPKKLARSLAVFSGAAEGVSLFSSFVVLLSFSRESMFLGLKQIISWSVLDENNHSDAGIHLYHLLIKERPELAANEEEVHEAFRITVDNEIKFINNAFADFTSDRITREQTIEYIKYRANNRLTLLGFRPLYPLNIELVREVSTWFHQMIDGISDNDFFASSMNGQGYQAMIAKDFASVDFTKFQKPGWLLRKEG